MSRVQRQLEDEINEREAALLSKGIERLSYKVYEGTAEPWEEKAFWKYMRMHQDDNYGL